MTATPEPRSSGSAPSEGPSTPVDPSPPVASSSKPGRDETTEPSPKGSPSKDDGKQDGDPLRRSRTSGAYAALIAFAVVLVLLIIFIAQNTDSASVRYLGWEGSAPMAVLLLIATVAGMLLAGVAATARILQLRRRVKKERKR